MISRSTDIRSALRSRQRGFFLNPFRFGPAAPDNSAFFDATSTAKTVHALRVAVAGYSGPLVRVRRSSDSAEIDVSALQNGALDVPSLLSFVGAGSGFIVRWYDQKYQGDWVQGVHGNQPVIVNSGIIQTENSKPKIVFSGQQFMTAGNLIGTSDSMSLCMASDAVGFGRGEGSAGAQFGWSIQANPNFLAVVFNGKGAVGYSVDGSSDTAFKGARLEVNNSTFESLLRIYQNGAVFASLPIDNYFLRDTSATLTLGRINNSYVNGSVAELVLHNALLSTEAAAAIQANWVARFAL